MRELYEGTVFKTYRRRRPAAGSVTYRGGTVTIRRGNTEADDAEEMATEGPCDTDMVFPPAGVPGSDVPYQKRLEERVDEGRPEDGNGPRRKL
ncbi:TPA: hypothetical protein HA265_00990 [Candidatus Woesearchaeota archaeon]|nr:hypothetical protein [Candidatus Woesearchaeota archaeon]